MIVKRRCLWCRVLPLEVVATLAFCHRISKLKDQHRATMEQVVDLLHRYMELESDPWNWKGLGFDDFVVIPVAMINIFEDLRPTNP